MRFLYPLDLYPANFNFFEFLVAARTRGATTIVFKDTGKFRKPYPDNPERLNSILLPGCALAGCEYEFGDEGKSQEYHISAVIKVWKEFGRIERLKSVLPPKTEKYTVTLRDYGRKTFRDSNRKAWERFANRIGAFVIEDYTKQKISLHERMAYYAGAEMNFFVANGPGSLCQLSSYPCMSFMHNVHHDYHRQHGYPVGSQLPFHSKNQLSIWEEDSFDNLVRNFDAWKTSLTKSTVG